MYLVDIYRDLTISGQELSYTEIAAFCSLRNVHLKPFEIEILYTIRRAAREGFNSD